MISLTDKAMLAAFYEGYSIFKRGTKGAACRYWIRAREKAGIKEAPDGVLELLIGAESLKDRGVFEDVSYECSPSSSITQVIIKPKANPWMLERYIRYRPRLGCALIRFEMHEADEQEKVWQYIR